nr:carbohydrate ABC transporter permease [Caldicoprobacter guelmensis]
MAVLVGYVMARYEFKGKKLFFAIIICSQLVPGVLTLIPSFVMVSRIPFAGGNNWMGIGGKGLINNRLMLFLPFGWDKLLWVFLFMQSMRSLPKDLEEAAEIDGCSFMRMIFRILIPLQKPIIAVIAVNTALSTWNDWLTPFIYINRIQDSTLPAYVGMLTAQLQAFGERDYPKLFATATVAIVPPFLIFLFMQKYIVQGIASVGIKG